MERLRGSSHPRKDDHHELQIGRLKQDRVHIPRGDDVREVVGVALCLIMPAWQC